MSLIDKFAIFNLTKNICLFICLSPILLSKSLVAAKPVVSGKLKDNNNEAVMKNLDVKDANNINNLELVDPLDGDHNIEKKNKLEELKFEAIKVVDNIKKDSQLSLDKLKPVDHIDAMKMEQDGHLNKEYHKELFLGNHEEIEQDEEHAEAKLLDIFHRVDSDSDGHLSEAEMESWIVQKMEEHFDEALRENDEIFQHLDPEGNGKVHWKEYYTHFLLAKGYEEKRAKKHVEDYDEIELEPDAKEELVRYKFRWTDADIEPADNQLNKTEFLGFRHPEQSDKMLGTMVLSIMNQLDVDENSVLSLKEFIALPPGEVEGEDFKEMDLHWQEERKKEFSESIDLNHDGNVTKEELKVYLDPRNPVQALMEARNLISLMDEDRDKTVSKDEVLKHKDIFLASKVVDFAANVHDEF